MRNRRSRLRRKGCDPVASTVRPHERIRHPLPLGSPCLLCAQCLLGCGGLVRPASGRIPDDPQILTRNDIRRRARRGVYGLCVLDTGNGRSRNTSSKHRRTSISIPGAGPGDAGAAVRLPAASLRKPSALSRGKFTVNSKMHAPALETYKHRRKLIGVRQRGRLFLAYLILAKKGRAARRGDRAAPERSKELGR